jgi:peptidoglycan lytic transglycosylase
MLKRLVVLVVALTCLVASPASAEVASCYGPGYEGQRTASGDIYNMWGFTAAHPFLPLGTPLTVCHRGHCAHVVVNDRGPLLDLSFGACSMLDMFEVGVDEVAVF